MTVECGYDDYDSNLGSRCKVGSLAEVAAHPLQLLPQPRVFVLELEVAALVATQHLPHPLHQVGPHRQHQLLLAQQFLHLAAPLPHRQVQGLVALQVEVLLPARMRTGPAGRLLVGVVRGEGRADGTCRLPLVLRKAFPEPQHLPIVVFILKHRNDHKNYIKLRPSGVIRPPIYSAGSGVGTRGTGEGRGGGRGRGGRGGEGKKFCDRESNPGLSDGNAQFYH